MWIASMVCNQIEQVQKYDDIDDMITSHKKKKKKRKK